MSRVLVLANETVGPTMAGPAIRAFELARALQGAGHEVTLAAPWTPTVDAPAFELAACDRRSVRGLAARADVIVIQGWVLERFPALASAGARLVVDLYDPFGLELLMLLEGRPAGERAQAQANALRALHDQLRAGDFFLCASEKQRDYWLGWLDSAGRVNSHTHAQDPSLRALIDVVPFGVPAERPRRDAPRPREVLGIPDDVVLLLWGGGVYNWFDPETVVRAAARVPEAVLVFMSARHPRSGDA